MSVQLCTSSAQIELQSGPLSSPIYPCAELALGSAAHRPNAAAIKGRQAGTNFADQDRVARAVVNVVDPLRDVGPHDAANRWKRPIGRVGRGSVVAQVSGIAHEALGRVGPVIAAGPAVTHAACFAAAGAVERLAIVLVRRAEHDRQYIVPRAT